MARRMIVASGLSALALGGGGWAVAAVGPAPPPQATPPGGAHTAAAKAPAGARKPAPGLVRFASCRALAVHARRRAMEVVGPYGLGVGGIMYRRDAAGSTVGGAVAPSAAPATPEAGTDYSGTNVQEAGVDEPDAVKTDGRTIFSVGGGRLQVVDVTGSAPRTLAGLDLEGVYPSGLMLDGDRLIVFGDSGYGMPMPVTDVVGVASTSVMSPQPWTPATVIVQVDVADPAHPRVLARLKVDGAMVSARRTDGTVRVALSSGPTRVPMVMAATSEGAAVRKATRTNRRILARVGAGAWLPRLTLHSGGRTMRRPAVPCTSVSRPTDYSGLGMIDVLTLGVKGTMSVLDSDAVMSDGELVYASPTGMYIATSQWSDPGPADVAPPRGRTLIHSFDTADPARTTYRASGLVRGYLLNQFSMSEKDGFLRVATTEEPTWWTPPSGAQAPSESFVTVLGASGGQLERVGQVGGLGRGERIQAVRFLGDRGYVVTFRQTDPLYALDLSDPAHPAVRGELAIPGYSSYLHPVDENTLIGVGQAADASGRTQGTQVSLFDVTDITAPRRIAQRTLDTDWSEAEADHHAFTYWAPTRTLVLPVQTYSTDGSPAFTGAVGLTVSRETGITPIARVLHPGGSESWSPVRRSIVIGDALYTVSDTGVMSSDLATLAPRGWTRLR